MGFNIKIKFDVTFEKYKERLVAIGTLKSHVLVMRIAIRMRLNLFVKEF